MDMPQQYARFPYPPYDPYLEAQRFNVTRLDKLDKVSAYCFNGELDPRQGMQVLVAGGGTGEATVFLAEQLRHTPSEVVHVDVRSAQHQ
jgi:ubiquinone/menaquinone biosynthesis C-methylase UbiE